MQTSIGLGVQEILLSNKAPALRSVRVRVKLPKDVVSMSLETASVNVQGSGPVRFDWAHHVQLTERGRSWVALKAALDHARTRPGALP